METKNVLKSSQLESAISNDMYGNNGAAVHSPVSESEISELLQHANQEGKKVTILSGGTKRGYGGLRNDYDIVLSLADYKGIVEHTPGDMTVTVRPGTTVKELQEFLKEFSQMVSLDPSWPEQATIGGIIASNESGPKRMKYGSARDLVIGLRVAYPDGTIIRTGGKVVKNVAGYDMNKLFIGSMGTLGVITEITMKLRPIPKCESLVKISVPNENLKDVQTFAVKIQDSLMEPVTLELLNPSLSKRLLNKENYHLLIGLEDVENSVRHQAKWIESNKPEGTTAQILNESEAELFWRRFSKASPNSLAHPETEETQAVLKISTKNMDVFEIIREAEALQANSPINIEIHGGMGHGITYAILTGKKSEIISAIGKLRDQAEMRKGYAVAKHLPYEWRKEVDVWGPQPAYFFLLKDIKKKVDSNNTLNHQRFVGGI
ncbi:FAD-binding oxidoreductase [Halobacillus sp. Marseille-Q1614]|uniref:FAD-binding oxidoreductase n=1 Tax=Halobacillus sp. Marseille-Q1614 TaxID=2709134 RepID=UPI00156E594E|nr:FAD-binding oxidoreductase [Halobacillus sp. Marseille-Q1614]